MRRVWWLASPLLLPLLSSGCALPPALTIASFAADGVSYAATGKSVGDHGISAVTGHDCALLRPVLREKPVCDTAGTERAKDVPVEIGRNGVARRAEAGPGPDPALPARNRYVTVGSFLNKDNAVRVAARYAEFNPAIIAVKVQGRRFHRVVIGPLSRQEAAALRARLAPGLGVAG